jgi:cell wall-associated NlpC family hydrolase
LASQASHVFAGLDLVLSPEALGAFKAHVLASYPNEAAGVVVRGSYVSCHNTSAAPLSHFSISAEELARIEIGIGPVEAILHSHPYDPKGNQDCPPEWPSANDMESWMKGTTPWGIVATDGEGISQVLWLDDANPAPLEGRPFVWGVNDCYSLIRDWYRMERGITIPNYARQWKFWERNQPLYDDNFAHAGFTEIKASEVQPGDVVLMKIMSRHSAHGGIVTGPDTLFHHLIHRQSGYDRLHKWTRCINKFLRYTGQKSC